MKWIKPNGTEIDLNDSPANIEAAEKAGLVRAEEPTVDEPLTGPKQIKLYKRLEGEIVEGEEPPEEVIIESESFTEKEAKKKIKEGWFATEEEAAEAPADKPKEDSKGGAASGAVTTDSPR
jgi:hypothetical protein